MAVAKDNTGLVRVSEMPVWLNCVVIDVIPFFKQWVAGRRGRLPGVHLRGVGEHGDFGWPGQLADAPGRLVRGRGQIQVVAVAVGGASGLAFELLQRVVQRRTNFHAPSAQIRKERAGSRIERPRPFAAAREPAEPVEIAAVGGDSTITKRMATVIVPIHLRRQAKLPQVANAFDPLCRRRALDQGRQKQRRQHGDDHANDKQFNERESVRLRREARGVCRTDESLGYATLGGWRTVVSPHPDPLPRGEGTTAARHVFCARWLGKLRRDYGPESANDSPSPLGPLGRGPG